MEFHIAQFILRYTIWKFSCRYRGDATYRVAGNLKIYLWLQFGSVQWVSRL
jgi:hypothetical protein